MRPPTPASSIAAEYEQMVAASLISPEQLRIKAAMGEYGQQILATTGIKPFPPEAIPLPSGGYALPPTKEPQPNKPSVETPAFTPNVAKLLDETLQRPDAREALQRRLLTRQRKPYMVALTKLLDEAKRRRRWMWQASADYLGEKFGKSHTAAHKTMSRLDLWGILGYRHPARREDNGTAPMIVDLQPLVRWLWAFCCEKLMTPSSDPEVINSSQRKEWCAPRGYVLQMYTGNARIPQRDGGELVTGDASAYVPYRFAIERRQLVGINAPLTSLVLVRNLNMGALFALDALLQIEGGTVREVEGEAGMSNLRPGLKILVQLGLADVSILPLRGRPRFYQLRPDWQARLHRLLPDMVGYGAADRLLIRNLSRNFDNLEKQIEREDSTSQQCEQLRERQRKVSEKLRQVKAQAALRGTYGRPRMERRI